MTTTIGSREARTKLHTLLRRAEMGERFVITSRGRPIAELVPCRTGRNRDRAAAVKKLKALMLEQPAPGVDVRSLIEEGRG